MFNFPTQIPASFYLALAKIFFLVLSIFSIVFLLVVYKQVGSMNKIVNDTNDSIILRLISMVLLILSISLFIAAFVIL